MMQTVKTAALGAVLLLAGVARADDAQPPFPLVDGDRHATIVGASQFLRDAVKKCTGVTLAQVPEQRYQPKEGDFPVYVGDSARGRELFADDIAKLDVEGYILHVEPTFAVIYARAPKTDTGDPRRWSEADFARRVLGADQYFPGSLGCVYPKREKALAACGHWVENPAFKHRHWSGYSGAAGAVWRVRASGGGGRFQYHHNLYRIIDPRQYKDHPEYFPVIFDETTEKDRRKGLYADLKPGERYVPKQRFEAYWQPCTTNPDVLRITVDAALAAIAKTPDNPVFSLGVNDSGGYCQCPACLKVTPPGVDPRSREANGYRMYQFYERVAEQVAAKEPRARLGFLIYSDLNAWTPKKLNPILMPYRTLSFADCWDAAYKQRIHDDLDRRAASAAHFGIYEWYQGQGFFIPRIYLHEMAAGLRHAHELGAEGFYAEAYANWGLDGPKLWVTERLLWDPKLDVDKLLDEWCAGLFGEAGPAIRAYCDFLEQTWVAQKPSNDRRGGYRLLQSTHKAEQFSEVFPVAACDRAWNLLTAAEAAAQQDDVRARIAYFRNSFGATRLAVHRFDAAAKLDAMQKEEAARLRAKDAVPRPAYDWLLALEDWAAYPALEDYMDGLRLKAPFAFQEFCQEDALNRANAGKPVKHSFAQWDTDTGAIRFIADRIVAELLAGKPAGRNAYVAAAEALLKSCPDRAAAEGRTCEHAAAVLKPLLTSPLMEAGSLAKAPTLDGVIEPEIWGEPQFDGNFFRYPYETQPAEERTRVWFGVCGKTIYVAFHCSQDPKSVLHEITGRDQVKINAERKVMDFGGVVPYLGRVDSIGVAFPGYEAAVVTSAGGLLDAIGTPYGYKVEWNGAQAAVKTVDDGWCAEIAVTLDERSFAAATKGAVRGFNFFRVCGGVRSAWVPGQPRFWAIVPRTSGVVMFQDK